MNKTVVNNLWPMLSEKRLAPFRIHAATGRPFRDIDVSVESPRIRASLEHYAACEQTEYVYHYRGGASIEPRSGWIVTDDCRLIGDSLPYNHVGTKPSIKKYVETRWFHRDRIRRFGTVISFRELAETNYFHFFNDVLCKVALLERHGVDLSLPKVVSRALWETRFCRAILERMGIKDNNWIVQDDFYVGAEEVIFCKVMPITRTYYDRILDMMRVPDRGGCGDRRVFVTRRGAHVRRLANSEEVESVFGSRGFEVRDPEEMAVDAQIELFSNARYVAGVHGAGLTNIMFRRAGQLDLLEMFPPSSIPPHYFWLSKALGHRHAGVVGEATSDEPTDPTFKVDPCILDEAIGMLLDRPETPADCRLCGKETHTCL